MTYGNIASSASYAPPRISEVEGVNMPGQAFMREVFALKKGETGAAMNQPQTVAYVIRRSTLPRRRTCCWPSSRVLRPTRYAVLAQGDMAADLPGLVEGVEKRRRGLTWTPDRVQALRKASAPPADHPGAGTRRRRRISDPFPRPFALEIVGMNSSPALLVLAAGMGSRYGGLKQVDPVGPHGEFILDYSVYDALRAGFRKIVFVIRGKWKRRSGRRSPRGCREISRSLYACQELDMLPHGFSVPPGRKKPWGTGHAVWAARDCVREPMLVINADDFYGAAAYQTAADYFDLAGEFVRRRLFHGRISPSQDGLAPWTGGQGRLPRRRRRLPDRRDGGDGHRDRCGGEISAPAEERPPAAIQRRGDRLDEPMGLYAVALRPVGASLPPVPPRSRVARDGRVLPSRGRGDAGSRRKRRG